VAWVTPFGGRHHLPGAGLFHYPLLSGAATAIVRGWSPDEICDHLQHLDEMQRLLISIPPRHGKPTLAGVLPPAWDWVNRPRTKFLCSSYSLKGLPVRDSIACRQVIGSPTYQRLWGVCMRPGWGWLY
jgi:hypothetical protein